MLGTGVGGRGSGVGVVARGMVVVVAMAKWEVSNFFFFSRITCVGSIADVRGIVETGKYRKGWRYPRGQRTCHKDWRCCDGRLDLLSVNTRDVMGSAYTTKKNLPGSLHRLMSQPHDQE